MHPHHPEHARLEAYRRFADRWEVTDFEAFVRLYDVHELTAFLPPEPTADERAALDELIGVEGETYGYLDWVKSNNTFELIMRWQERTGRFVAGG
ncbi:MAG: hypothetical protein WBA12_10125 [Catalinimonas sp.]